LHDVVPGGQAIWQTPFMQVCPAMQQVEPHAVCPAGHVTMLQEAGGHSVTHFPRRQTWPVWQVVPQSPQLSGSIAMTAQIEPQRFRP
jgi:hypothetical protein